MLPDARELAWPFCGPDSRSSLMGKEVLRKSLDELSKVPPFWRMMGDFTPKTNSKSPLKNDGLEDYLFSKMLTFSVGHANFAGE